MTANRVTESSGSLPLDGTGFEALARRRVVELVENPDLEAMAVVFNLVRAANRMMYDLELRVHRPLGWSWAGFRILFTLWIAGPLEPRQLARLSAVTRSSISAVLNTLERDGFIERLRASRDRRVVTVRLTDRGQASVREGFRRNNLREHDLVGDLTAEEQRVLADLLRKLLAGHDGASEPTAG